MPNFIGDDLILGILHHITDFPALLIGVNIGGAGTLIASLASLITLREFMRFNPEKTKSYILMFSAFNFGFLILLTAVCSML